MSLIFATQLTAVATAALAAFAIFTGVFAYLAYRKQTQEVGILQKQMDEQLKATARQSDALELQAKERHRAQASKIFIVEDSAAGHENDFKLVNSSDQPVYKAIVHVQRNSGDPWASQDIGTLLPGASLDVVTSQSGKTVLTFRDAADFYWLRAPDGELIERHPVQRFRSFLAQEWLGDLP